LGQQQQQEQERCIVSDLSLLYQLPLCVSMTISPCCAVLSGLVLLLQVLLSGTFVPPSDLDLPKWAAWLAANGYRNKQGWDTLMAGLKVSGAAAQAMPTANAKQQSHCRFCGRWRCAVGSFCDVNSGSNGRIVDTRAVIVCHVLPMLNCWWLSCRTQRYQHDVWQLVWFLALWAATAAFWAATACKHACSTTGAQCAYATLLPNL
jgi:hypothetical protein